MENESFSMYDGRYSKGGFLCAGSGKDRHCLWNRDAVLLSGSGEAAVPAKEKAAGRNTFSEDGGYIRACSGGNRTAAMGAALGIIEAFLEKI